MFLYRDEELLLLNNEYEKPSSCINLLFGRRKVGKTSFLNEYTKNKRTIYLVATELVSHLLMQNFNKSVIKSFSLVKKDKVSSLEELFTLIYQQDILSKLVIIIDDFHNLLKVDKNSLKIVFDCWNKFLSEKNIQLILSSSNHSSSKEDLFIYKKASLSLFLESINMSIIKQMLPSLNKNDLVYVYSSFGTNPQYLKLYDEKKDFILNIKDNFLSFDSFVFHEGLNIIKNDLSDVTTYASILYALSMGNKKIGDIANFLNLKSSYLTRYMQKLIDIMIIKKIVPINEDINNSKFGRYEIDDNFIKFWFCYIYPNYSSLHKQDLYPVISHIRKDFSKRLVRDAYKRYIMELIRNEENELLAFSPKVIGSWWNNKDNDIDIVAYNSTYITFIDCLWRKNSKIEYDYTILKNKSSYFKTSLIKKYIIFSKNSSKTK